MSVEAADNDEGAILVLESGDVVGDLRTFPERVYDMVHQEDQQDHGLILWEEGGNQFAMNRRSIQILDILENHIGKRDITDFEKRLFKHGWETAESTTNPGMVYAAYRNDDFRRGMERSHLKDIKRKRKLIDRIAETPNQPQNPQDASGEGISKQEGEVNEQEEGHQNSIIHENETGEIQLQQQPEGSDAMQSGELGHQPQVEGGDGTHGDQGVVDLLDEDDEGVQEEVGLSDGENVASIQGAGDGVVEEPQDEPEHGDDKQGVQEVIDISYETDESETPIAEDGQGEPMPHGGENVSTNNQIGLEHKSREGEHVEENPKVADGNSDQDAPAAQLGEHRPGDGENVARENGANDEDDDGDTIIEIEDDDSEIEFLQIVSPAAAQPAASLQATESSSAPSPKDSSKHQGSAKQVLASSTATTVRNCAVEEEREEAAQEMDIDGPNSPFQPSSTPDCPTEDSKPAAVPRQVGTAMLGDSRKAPNCKLGSKPNHYGAVMDKTSGAKQEQVAIQSPAAKALGAKTSTKNGADSVEGNKANDAAVKLNNKDSQFSLENSAPHSLKNSESIKRACVSNVANLEFHNAAANPIAMGQEANVRPVTVRDIDKVKGNEIAHLVKQCWKDAQQDCESKAEELLQKTLLEKRNKVIHAASDRKRSVRSKARLFQEQLSASSPCSVSTNTQGMRNTWMTANQNGSQQRVLRVKLDGAEAPQPVHNSPMNLSRLQFIDDEKELNHVPYFVEDQDKLDTILNKYYETEQRKKRLERGATCEEDGINRALDRLLHRLCDEFCCRDANGVFDASQVDRVSHRISDMVTKETDIDSEWLQERFNVLKQQPLKVEMESEEIEDSSSLEDAAFKEYSDGVDTFRSMLCTRCFTYNCSFHAIGDDEKPSLALQYEKGVRRVENGYWETVEFSTKLPRAAGRDKGLQRMVLENPGTELSETQQALCQRFYVIFGGDVVKIAAALRAPTDSVQDFIVSKQMKLPALTLLDKQAGNTRGTKKYTSMNNYNKHWIANINKTIDHPWCSPCSHDGICSDDNCSCVQNAFFCTKACGHAEFSPNFFRGCECNGYCSTNSCTCLAANRECDPDLCKSCGACTDPPNTHKRVNQKCRNDNMSMRRHRRLLIGKSTVAGWGLFTKDPLKKGDFVHEYIGELVTQEEGERRGHLYDLADLSYLFNQSTEYVVDATLKGNKVRFGNHSDTPNVCTKKMFVNGNVRIGFYANQNIDAQSELFINYHTTFTARGNFVNDMTKSEMH